MEPGSLDLFLLQDTLHLGVRTVELDSYDFDFRRFLPCRSLVYGTAVVNHLPPRNSEQMHGVRVRWPSTDRLPAT